MASRHRRWPLRGERGALAEPTGKSQQGGQGQALVEFGLVVALLFALLFGIIDFARLFFAYATMSNGVREGARYGIVHPPYPLDQEEARKNEVRAAARSMMVLIGGDATIEVDYPDVGLGGDIGCVHWCRIVVVATSDFPVWTPFIPNVQIEAKATMHFE